MAFVFVWILGCDFLILVYGIQFDLKELFGFTDDVQHAVDDASAICPTDFYTWMDYFWKIQYLLVVNKCFWAIEALNYVIINLIELVINGKVELVIN